MSAEEQEYTYYISGPTYVHCGPYLNRIFRISQSTARLGLLCSNVVTTLATIHMYTVCTSYLSTVYTYVI